MRHWSTAASTDGGDADNGPSAYTAEESGGSSASAKQIAACSCGLSESCSDLRWSTSSLSSSTSEKLELEDLSVRSEPGEGDSLSPEVQANVSNKDDQTALVLTLRTWVIGLVFCAVIAAFNCFCRMRYPSPIVTPVVTLILSYPVGGFLAHVLPRRSVPVPSPLARLGLPAHLSLNPGPFSIKEHSLVLVMANVSTGPAFALDYLLVGSKFYSHTYSLGFSIILVLSSQLLSFGAAGLFHRVIVQPASMVWPQNLPYCALLDTLHRGDKERSVRTSRYRYFAWVAVGAFAWFWLPDYLFTALSAFSWVCWLAPKNVVVNQLFGVGTGLGMGVFTFDWAQIAYVTSPMVMPWWAQANVFGGFVLAFWIVTPALYYSNVFDAAFLPMSIPTVFDRFGQPYNSTRILDAAGSELDVTAYAGYSPVYMPMAFVIAYAAGLMIMTAFVVNTSLFNGKEIWRRLRRRPSPEDVDVHVKLMQEYPEVPDWAYLAFLLGALGLSIAAVAAWPTDLPAWALIVAVALGLLYLIPAGYVFAVTSIGVSVNYLAELLAGFLVPGKPLANILFKVYASNVINVGLYFAQDLKLSIYMKLPPRTTFTVQVVAVAVTSCVQVGVQRWFIDSVPTLCDEDQHAKLSCPAAHTMHGASIIWGLIGPARLFGPGKPYHPLLYSAIPGAVIPVVCWLILRRWPNSSIRRFNPSVALAGLAYVPPATGINFSSAALVGFIFQYLVRRRYSAWWTRYNFLTSAALDAGTVVSALIIFLSLQLPNSGTGTLDWAGNTIYTRTADWLGTPYKTPPPGGFGPSTW
ncbi:hypothetical protein JCM8202_002357 [Rhodotorula sphaerocarpa]